MGISAAFLDELNAQRASALRELQWARASQDEGEAAVALARLRDLDELLARTDSTDVHLDIDVVLDPDLAADPHPILTQAG